MRRTVGRITAVAVVAAGATVVGAGVGPASPVSAATPLKAGIEFRVNAIPDMAQQQPDLAAMPNGQVKVAFADASFPNTGWTNVFQSGVRSQVVNPDGTLAGAPVVHIPIAASPFFNGYFDPEIAVTPTGQLVQTAFRIYEGLPFPQIEYVTTTTLGTPAVLPGSMSFAASNGDVELLSNGNFAALTSGIITPPGTNASDVMLTLMSPAGAVLASSAADALTGLAGTQDEASASAFTGGLAVAFRDAAATDITVVRTDNDGAAQNSQTLALAGAQSDPDIAAKPDGGYVVTFVDENPAIDGSGSSVRARYVTAAGAAGPVATVNTTTTGNQTQPVVTALPDGRFFIAWTDASNTEGPGGSGLAIRGQLFGMIGGALVPEGVEFLVNTFTGGDQRDPAVVTTTDGRIAVAWTTASTAVDPDNTGVSMQFLDLSVTADGLLAPGERVCFTVAGDPGDVAVVNLLPVSATGPGNGQLVSSDISSPPIASNVNFGPGTFDPNVAFAPIGLDRKVCYVNSRNASVHLVADHLGTIDKVSFTFASPSGAPSRKVDTRESLGGTRIAPSGRLCFAVGGTPGDVAVVNLTPLNAGGPGNAQLVSSDVVSVPLASNVNFTVGSIDPNVALAPIGADGRVCFANSVNTSVDLVADHLGTIAASAIVLPPGGAPARLVDTRVPPLASVIGPSGRLCLTAVGAVGSVAVVNLTPVNAQGPGNGQLVSSSVVTPPLASNVNFTTGSVDPNVALAPVGPDGRVCYVNSINTTIDLVADQLASINAAAFVLASPTGAPVRVVDTRPA